MKLYYKPTCPWSTKVRVYAHENDLTFELCDIVADPTFKEELTKRGGEPQVPYLVCDCGEEMYESSEIIEHLQSHQEDGKGN